MARENTLALLGGALIDVRDGSVLPETAVLVREGRIAWIGGREDFSPPPGARVEDVTGAWLIPGLVDMHVHLTFASLHTELLPLYLAHGVTTVRDVGGHLTPLSLLRNELRSGRCLGPHLHFAGPLLDGVPPLWPSQTVLVDTEPRARSAVRMLIDQGVDCVKVYNNVPERSLEAIVEEAHAAGRPVLGHVPRTLRTSRAVEIGMDCLEHIRVTGRELLPLEEADQIDFLPLGRRETLLWERFDIASPGMERLIELLVAARTFLDPTLIVDADTSLGSLQDPAAEETEAALPAEARAALRRDVGMDKLRSPEDWRERAERGFEKRLDFIRRCNEAGVRLLAGTDTFGPGAMLPGAGLLNELAYLHRAGLSPLQALQAATVTPAAALGTDGETGTLEVGKHADMVVLDGDPLADVHNFRRIRLVVHGGAVSTPASLIARAVENVSSNAEGGGQ